MKGSNMWNLVADVGGTNMRFAAISAAGKTLEQHTFPTNGPLDVVSASIAIIKSQGTAPTNVVVAAAGVVDNGTVKLTNSTQQFSESTLATATDTEYVKILNDFEAAAWSLATVTHDDVNMLQGNFKTSQAPRLIIGPGTGLGVGAMVWSDGKPHVVSGEGGHVTLAPQTAEEMPYFEALIALWPEVAVGNTLAVEAEAIVSGTGIPVFYKAIANARGLPAPLTRAQDIFKAAHSGDDTVAVIVIAHFRRYLGTIAGDLGLVFDAKGGVFITGGVALSNPWLFDDAFLDAFNAGGRHSNWRRQLPVSLYHNSDFGLIGAQNYISKR
jgi:glucokinase